ncbi:sulfoxide reductase heme-binding subunit YedZ [Deinococcus detaillensis]|uniref:Protein-methionine-sulfoxide reductase heme-binding subunit MsrQ n=1 Tax=Deinococcus detaillensis TaxID=2592048 RepID=A0A553V050_9DEIO|nr:sulfoxide reductase heme-binding subunit YedZ [Deinococcus detaillensis]
MSKATPSPTSSGAATAARPVPRRKVSKFGGLGPGIVVGGLVPMAVMLWDAQTGALGANPVQRLQLQTGVLSLALLILSLAATPLRLVTGWTWPARVRKALGLLAFLYATLHVLVYLVDKGLLNGDFGLATVVDDVVKRPFITVGFTAWLLLIPLALTSFKGSVKKLGFARWTTLHKLVYFVVALGVVHYWWGVKKDHTEPLIYGLVAATLLALRVIFKDFRSKKKAGGMGKTATPEN